MLLLSCNLLAQQITCKFNLICQDSTTFMNQHVCHVKYLLHVFNYLEKIFDVLTFLTRASFFCLQLQVLSLGSLLPLAVCPLIMSKPRFRKCNLMLKGSTHTPAL